VTQDARSAATKRRKRRTEAEIEADREFSITGGDWIGPIDESPAPIMRLKLERDALAAEVEAMKHVVHAARVYQLEKASGVPEAYREAFLKLDAALVDLYREVPRV